MAFARCLTAPIIRWKNSPRPFATSSPGHTSARSAFLSSLRGLDEFAKHTWQGASDRHGHPAVTVWPVIEAHGRVAPTVDVQSNSRYVSSEIARQKQHRVAEFLGG